MGMDIEKVIIADTSGLVSLFSPNDRNHTAVVKVALLLQTANRDILIPAAIFVEFLDVLGRQVNHTSALAAVAELPPPYIVLDDFRNLPKNPPLNKFAEGPEPFSFADCIVMAVADDNGTKDIFGFDKQFENAGYNRLKPPTT